MEFLTPPIVVVSVITLVLLIAALVLVNIALKE